MVKVQIELEIPPIGNVLLSLEDARELYRQLDAVFVTALEWRRWVPPEIETPKPNWQADRFQWQHPHIVRHLTGAVGE